LRTKDTRISPARPRAAREISYLIEIADPYYFARIVKELFFSGSRKTSPSIYYKNKEREKEKEKKKRKKKERKGKRKGEKSRGTSRNGRKKKSLYSFSPSPRRDVRERERKRREKGGRCAGDA